MKYIVTAACIILCLLFLPCGRSFAQGGGAPYYFILDKMNVMYMNVGNPITLAPLSSKQPAVTINNGTLTQSGPGVYTVRTLKPGSLTLSVADSNKRQHSFIV